MRRPFRLACFRAKFRWRRFTAGLMIVAFSATILVPAAYAACSFQDSHLSLCEACNDGTPVKTEGEGQPRVAHCSCHIAVPEIAEAIQPARESIIIRSPIEVALVPGPESFPLAKPPRT